MSIRRAHALRPCDDTSNRRSLAGSSLAAEAARRARPIANRPQLAKLPHKAEMNLRGWLVALVGGLVKMLIIGQNAHRNEQS